MSDDLLPIDHRLMGLLTGYGPSGIWPSIPELAGKLDCSDRWVQKRLQRLEQLGMVLRLAVYEQPDDLPWVERGSAITTPGRQTSNTYMLTGQRSGQSRSSDPGELTKAAAQTPVNSPSTNGHVPPVNSDTTNSTLQVSQFTPPGELKITPETPVNSGKPAAQTPVNSDSISTLTSSPLESFETSIKGGDGVTPPVAGTGLGLAAAPALERAQLDPPTALLLDRQPTASEIHATLERAFGTSRMLGVVANDDPDREAKLDQLAGCTSLPSGWSWRRQWSADPIGRCVRCNRKANTPGPDGRPWHASCWGQPDLPLPPTQRRTKRRRIAS